MTGARTLHFPDDRAVGMVLVARPGETPGAPEPAQGMVEAPEGAMVALTATTPGQPDAEALRALAPDGIDVLIGVVLDDDVAEALSGVTTVHTLMAGGGQVGDRGLAHLGNLSGLTMLTVAVAPEATADGIAHLASLPALRTLVLVSPVTAEQLAPLADAPKLANLQIPRAEAPVAEAARDIVPNATVNGVWLSPKARAKLSAQGGPPQ